MNKEDAIKIFLDRGWIEIEGRMYFDGDKWREAIMVISDYFRNEYKALQQEPSEDIGEVSDGYHTFNQLYHQRAILFATIVNQNKDIAWKSFKHSDGKYCFDRNGEWFIVGIDTPEGSYTYHYSKEYWDYFKCKELDCGKEWDGHTEKDVTRLLSLKQEPSVTPQPCTDAVSRECNNCAYYVNGANDEACDGCFADEYEHPNFKPKAQHCDDCVSRQAAIDALYKMLHDCFGADEEELDAVITTLNELSPVTPAEKVGQWIDGDDKCPCCGKSKFEGLDADIWADWQPKYCPNCGANMQGVENE